MPASNPYPPPPNIDICYSCVCVCVPACMCVCACMCMCVCACMCVRSHVCVCMFVFARACDCLSKCIVCVCTLLLFNVVCKLHASQLHSKRSSWQVWTVHTFLLRRVEVFKAPWDEVVDHVRQLLGQLVFLHRALLNKETLSDQWTCNQTCQYTWNYITLCQCALEW